MEIKRPTGTACCFNCPVRWGKAEGTSKHREHNVPPLFVPKDGCCPLRFVLNAQRQISSGRQRVFLILPNRIQNQCSITISASYRPAEDYTFIIFDSPVMKSSWTTCSTLRQSSPGFPDPIPPCSNVTFHSVLNRSTRACAFFSTPEVMSAVIDQLFQQEMRGHLSEACLNSLVTRLPSCSRTAFHVTEAKPALLTPVADVTHSSRPAPHLQGAPRNVDRKCSVNRLYQSLFFGGFSEPSASMRRDDAIKYG